MTQIQKVSSYLLIVLNFLLITLPLLSVMTWSLIDTELVRNLIAKGVLFTPLQTPEGLMTLAEIKWSLVSKTIGFFSEIIGLLPFLLSLFTLKLLFQNYQRKEIFTVRNARLYRRLGLLLFLDALVAMPLQNLLMILAVTFSNPPGHRYLTVSFGTPNMKPLFCGILVIVISWVMLEASKLQDEQKFTI